MIDELLNALSYVGDSLNKPGRAVRGVLAGNSGEAAAAIPFSDSLGLTDRANSTSGSDLLKSFGVDAGSGLGADAAGFATEVATDPLTWLGAGLGSKVGGAAERAAVARGPQYATTAADLGGMGDSLIAKLAARAPEEEAAYDMMKRVPNRISEILRHPNASRLLQEIPEGGQMLGAGAEAMAFGDPAGNVTRIGRTLDQTGRPAADGLLQALRSADISGVPGGTVFRSEMLPQAANVGDTAMMRKAMPGLDQQLANQGLSFTDRHAGNFGTVGGKPMVIDPGAVDASMFGGKFQDVIPSADPSMPMNALLKLLGARDAVRQGAPSFAPIMSLLGGGTGATAGAFSRLGG